MKNTSVTKIFTTAALSSLLTLSTAAMAEQTKWLNPLSFTGGANVKVSHNSPTYPGSLVVDIIAEEGAGEAEILKQFMVNEKHSLSAVVVCFRDFTSTLPFALQIYQKGVPTVDPDSGVMTVGVDTPLLTMPPVDVPLTQECTSIELTEDILPESGSLLLGIKFNYDAAPISPVVSAVGLVHSPLYLQLAECDETVFGREVEPGVTISTLVDECQTGAKNHGKFVSCVNKVANKLKKEGVITGKEKGMITRCVANSNLP